MISGNALSGLVAYCSVRGCNNSNGAGGSVVHDGVGSEGKSAFESKSGHKWSVWPSETYQAGNLSEKLVLKRSVIKPGTLPD